MKRGFAALKKDNLFVLFPYSLNLAPYTLFLILFILSNSFHHQIESIHFFRLNRYLQLRLVDYIGKPFYPIVITYILFTICLRSRHKKVTKVPKVS